MAEKKITQAERFEELKTLAAEAGRQDLVEFLDERIEKLADKAAKAKEKAAEKKAATDELKDKVLAALTSELQTPDAIADAIDAEDVTRAKVISRVKVLIDEGLAVKEQNEDKKMCYKLA